jgi:hypothetical protein
MFVKSSEPSHAASAETKEASQSQLHLALFDLGAQAFVSLRFDTPTLIPDTNGSHLMTARRIETFHTRNSKHYNLPALKYMGRLPSEDENVTILAAKPVHEKGIRFRDFTFRLYHLDELHSHIKDLKERDETTTDIDAIDAAFNTVPELRRFQARAK